MPTQVKPGDVVIVRNTRSPFSWLILLGAWLRGTPLYSHVIVAHHVDSAGVLWGIEGRPSGVGWVDVRAWLADKATLTTADQPKTDAQRLVITAGVEAMLGTPYDWDVIAVDAMEAIGAPALWQMDEFDGVKGVPGHVVCSSLAAYWYAKQGLPTPKPTLGEWRRVTPGEWAKLVLRHGVV